MTGSAADVRAILDRMDREMVARVDALERRYAPQPVSWWWWVAIGGFLLVCTAAGGAFGWMLTTVVLRATSCR